MSGIDWVCSFPGPWQQFVEPINWMGDDLKPLVETDA